MTHYEVPILTIEAWEDSIEVTTQEIIDIIGGVER